MPRIVNCFVLASALAAVAVCDPLHAQAHPRRSWNETGSACASVSALAASQTSLSASATPTVPAAIALECILSVPLNASAALNQLNSIRPYFEWQSTSKFLKNPPAEYVEKIQNPVDIFGGLDEIAGKIENGTFTREYEFGFSLYELLQSTHDGHFVYVPDSVGGIFNFGRSIPLVSVSDDGFVLPKAYTYPDVLAASFGNASFIPSHIVAIDGQPAEAWLENWAQYGSLQDRDALYNNVFYELAIVSLGTTSAGMGTFTGGGRGRWVYPGATTELTFANGSSYTMNNFATVLVDFDGVESGEDLYQLYFTTPEDVSAGNGDFPTSTAATVTPTPSTSSAAASSTSTTSTSTPAPGYPTPVVRQINNYIGGYYLEEEGYEDVAVLNVATFVSSDTYGEITFQETGQTFLKEAKAAGKTKLIVDVSANGGGTILQGYDLFRQLFPDIDAFAAADRTRAIEAIYLLGERFSEISGTVPRILNTDNSTLEEIEEDIVSSNLNYRTDEKPDGTPFTSWDEKFGPDGYYKGDNYTSLFRWNLSDVLTPINSGGINITGYGGYMTNATQPFAAEDVIVMTDGYCASTCTIFSALMRDLAGVKYVAMGGRSRPGITQAIGGVKGTNDWGWSDIQYYVQLAYNDSSVEEQAYFNTTSLAEYDSELPFLRAAANTAYNVNFRDGIKKGDFAAAEQVPLQFQYEAADCRIYWTAEMTIDITSAWKAVADSAWGAKDWCVAGSLGSTAGGYKRGASSSARSLRREVKPLRKRAAMADYPLDLWTDSKKPLLKGDAIMAH